MAVLKNIDMSQAKPWIPGTVFLDNDFSKNKDPSNVVLECAGEEMLKITKDGFWVRGVQVPQDEKEAKIVYDAFREWMTWASLTRKY